MSASGTVKENTMEARAIFKWHTYNGTDRHVCTVLERGKNTARVCFDQDLRMPGGGMYKAGEPVVVPVCGLQPASREPR